MKILFITPSPPNNLNRIRSKNILSEMCKRGYDVTLVSLYKNKKEKVQLEANARVQTIIGIYHPVFFSLLFCLIGFFLPVPFRVAFCFNPRLHLFLKRLNRSHSFDVIYIKRLRMSQYASHFARKKVLVDITDSMTKYYETLKEATSGMKRMFIVEEYLRHKKYEPRVCRAFKTIVCSENEKRYLVDGYDCPNSQFHIFENGINLLEWKPREVNLKSVNLRKLVFWGVMNVETNEMSCLFFIREVLPRLNKGFSFTVIGPKPSKRLIRCSSSRVHFKGHIDNIGFALNTFGIFVCPIIAGAGTKNKILQAVAIGLPVVTTSLGAEGIAKELRKFFFIADAPRQFESQIKKVEHLSLREYDILIKRQRKVLNGHYDISLLTKNFEREVLMSML